MRSLRVDLQVHAPASVDQQDQVGAALHAILGQQVRDVELGGALDVRRSAMFLLERSSRRQSMTSSSW